MQRRTTFMNFCSTVSEEFFAQAEVDKSPASFHPLGGSIYMLTRDLSFLIGKLDRKLSHVSSDLTLTRLHLLSFASSLFSSPFSLLPTSHLSPLLFSLLLLSLLLFRRPSTKHNVLLYPFCSFSSSSVSHLCLSASVSS